MIGLRRGPLISQVLASDVTMFVAVAGYGMTTLADSTLSALWLGGEVPDDPGATFAGWRKALRLPNVLGLVAGRSLLYPPDGDVAAAVDAAVGLL